MMAFIGVRISWLILARKTLLALLAISALCCALGQLISALRDHLFEVKVVFVQFCDKLMLHSDITEYDHGSSHLPLIKRWRGCEFNWITGSVLTPK
ncbi:MAG: hypothetical protein RNU03_00840 [Candidatus Sedimenticola sp. (ex Thyasira tokunagai)]